MHLSVRAAIVPAQKRCALFTRTAMHDSIKRRCGPIWAGFFAKRLENQHVACYRHTIGWIVIIPLSGDGRGDFFFPGHLALLAARTPLYLIRARACGNGGRGELTWIEGKQVLPAPRLWCV